ncbi:Olfactory Receptor 14I1 [Manis pentadactyla]|nr:Olfactory Receptor 14I1 [Manis pentadactyla]
MAVNLVTIAVIVTDPCLHSPMYFSICNLSLIDLRSISDVVPKSIVNSLTGIGTWRHLCLVAYVCLIYISDTWEHTVDVMTNYTGVTEFPLGLSEDSRMQTLHGILFLMAYLAALLGNGLIIMLITWDPQLHTPMYFFLKKLSLIDLCYISVTVPKFVLNSLMKRNTISFLGCVFQVLFFAGFGAAEFAILTVMSYECYVAVCCLLHYEAIMNKGACEWMVVPSYVSALIYGAMHVSATFSTNFSSNKSINSAVISFRLW